MKNTLPRPIRAAFNKAGCINLGYGLMKSKHFFVRIFEFDKEDKRLQPGERRWTVEFAYRPTFDRWANSTNFKTEIWFNPKKNQRWFFGEQKGLRKCQYTVPDFNKEFAWANKVAKSGLFNFNTYFSAIKTPWFIH